MRRAHLGAFGEAWSSAASAVLQPEALIPTVWTDGVIDGDLDLSVCAELSELEPYGKQWEVPIFQARARVTELRPVGDGSHLKLGLAIGSQRHEGIWFSAVRDGVVPLSLGADAQIAFELDVNEFNGVRRLQLRVRHASRVV